MEYKIAKTKKDIRNIYSFRKEIYTAKQAGLDYKDNYDEMKRTINHRAVKNNKIYANVRLIKGVNRLNGFSLPIEKHFKLSFYKKHKILPVEFSKLLISDNVSTNDIIIKFLTFVFQYADKHSMKYLCTLANTGTDDSGSVRTVYKIIQIKNLLHPHIKTSGKKEEKSPDNPVSPLYDKEIIEKMEKYSRLNYKRLAKLEKSGLNMPVNIQLYTKIGFQATSIPAFILDYNKYVMPMILEIEKARIKDLKYDFNKKESLVTKKEINCRTANSVIKYVKSQNGDINKLLKGINFSEKYLTDEYNWIDCQTTINLFRNARILLKDNEIGYKIGLSSGQLKSIGILTTFYKLLSTPLITFKMADKLSELWNRVQNFKTVIINKNKINVSLSKGSVFPSKEICDMTKGLCNAIPLLWNLKTKVEEIECVRKGDKHCKYIIEWELQKSIIKRIYFSTFDKIKTLIEAKKILKQKQQLIITKILELKQKNYENKKLNRLFNRKNIKLQEVINNKIKELEKVYKKKLQHEEIIHNKERMNTIENLTGIIAHEIKSNISSVDLLYDKFLKENLINKNREYLFKSLDLIKDKINKSNLITTLDKIHIIDKNYKDINYSINNTNKIIKESIELCKLILNNYSQFDIKKENINSLIKKFYKKNKEKFNKHNIQLNLNPLKNNNIKFNKNHFLTLIQNITSNSYNALIFQKRKISKKIWIKTMQQNKILIIEIKDNGPGIPVKYQSLIYKPFFTTSAKRLGLGLPFCMKIIKHYNGKIEFNSSQKETAFKIYLPLINSL